MTNIIHVKLFSENALTYIKENLSSITKKIIENDDNSWIYKELPQPLFFEKSFEIEDFELEDNPEGKDIDKDFKNGVTLYEHLKKLPRYILCDERFWLWLHFEKFYLITKRMMKIKGDSTIRDHWLHGEKRGNHRRGLMFGVLSRLYFRVEFSICEREEDKFQLTKWVFENPERYRNLTWRSFSSEQHLVRGVLKGEKKAINEFPDKEDNDFYPIIAKYVAVIGSVRLLDQISEDDIEGMIYQKMLELINGD